MIKFRSSQFIAILLGLFLQVGELSRCGLAFGEVGGVQIR